MACLCTYLSLLGLLFTAVVHAVPTNDTATTAHIDIKSADPDFKVPIINPNSPDRIPGSYLVVFKNTTTKSSIADYRKAIGTAIRTANSGKSAKAVKTTTKDIDNAIINWHITIVRNAFDDNVLKILMSHDVVDYIEQDMKSETRSIVAQSDPPWGLSRLSCRTSADTLTNHPNRYRDYYYDSKAGRGIVVYILDTGVDASHPEFQGRVIRQLTFTGSKAIRDDHGTSVASIIGGKTCGVAKEVRMIDVKISDRVVGLCSNLVDALNWTMEDMVEYKYLGKALINVAISCPLMRTLNTVVNHMLDLGIPIFTAAGSKEKNEGFLPVVLGAFTFSSINGSDYLSDDSDYWSGVYFAPGIEVTAASFESHYVTKSGTSLATAHGTGLGAYFMSLGYTSLPELQHIFEATSWKNGAYMWTDTAIGPIINNGIH